MSTTYIVCIGGAGGGGRAHVVYGVHVRMYICNLWCVFCVCMLCYV